MLKLGPQMCLPIDVRRHLVLIHCFRFILVGGKGAAEALVAVAAIGGEGGAALGKRIDVRLTREGDVNVGLAERAALARQVGASHFLSLHFNGFNGVARGSETFYAAASNGNVNEAADKAFAQLIQTALLESLQRTGLAVKNRGVKADADTPHRRLGLLADAHLGNTPGHAPCVACLTELEFIDVPEVDRHLISGPQALRNRGAVAEGLANALLKALQQG